MHDFSIIIPQHGECQRTFNAIQSLQRTQVGDFEVLIVDDGSDFVTWQQLRAQLQAETRPAQAGNLMLLRIPRRQGITVAWNRGASLARGRILIFLNNDTISQGPWLQDLTAPLELDGLNLTAPRAREKQERGIAGSELLEGWCLALRQETFFAQGGFDERFRLYYSDTDLQFRLLQQSASALRACPGLPLIHLGHCSTRKLPSRSAEWRRDRERFLQKWNPIGMPQ